MLALPQPTFEIPLPSIPLNLPTPTSYGAPESERPLTRRRKIVRPLLVARPEYRLARSLPVEQLLPSINTLLKFWRLFSCS